MQQRSKASSSESSKARYIPTNLPELLADIIIANALPYSFVESPGAKTLVNSLLRIAGPEHEDARVSLGPSRVGVGSVNPRAPLTIPPNAPYLSSTLTQKTAWAGASRRSVTRIIVERAEARQLALDKELAKVLTKTPDGLRTRVNVSFDEWTDRAKRSWMAVNVTYVKDGIMKRRLLSVTALVAEETAKAADAGSSRDGE